MSMKTTKYKLSDMAKDLKVTNNDLIECLGKLGGEPKKTQSVLTPEEISYVLEYYTQNNQVDSFDAFYANNVKPAKEEKKTEAESEAFVFEPLAPNIAFDDFAKVDLRIGKILDCKKVEKSRKLLQLTIDIGEKEPRNIFSGIAAYYKPEDLIGRLTVVVANLEPRKMMGSFSQGMLLSASDGADTPSGLYLLEPFPGARPGMRLH